MTNPKEAVLGNVARDADAIRAWSQGDHSIENTSNRNNHHRLVRESGSLSLEGAFKGTAEPIQNIEPEDSPRPPVQEEEDPNKPCFTSFFFQGCSPKQFLFKTSIVLVFCAIIAGLSLLLEPKYPEIIVFTPKSHELCMKELIQRLPRETLDRISNKYSPQAKALRWMDNDPKLNIYPAWRHRQRLALATIYYAFNGVLWPERDRHGWLSYDKSECEWGHHGEKVCEEATQRMERLVLSDIRNFRGKMPPEINLFAPSEISITHMTSQTSTIEDLLPKDKASLAQLRRLDFSHTHLHGTMPEKIGWMFNLEEMDFSEGSGLAGKLPRELVFLDNLKSLKLQGNQLTGSIPDRIASLRTLEHVDLQRNLLTGRITDELCSLTSLMELRLDDNCLEGAVPECMASMHSLVDFTYGGTNLIAP